MLWFQRTAQMFNCTRSLQKVEIIFIEISTEFRLITIIFVWREYIITYLSGVLTWVKWFIVSQKLFISKKFKFWWVHNNAPLKCDDFVFRKVNWPLSLRRGEWVVFRLMAKLLLGVTKPNCQCSLISIRALF